MWVASRDVLSLELGHPIPDDVGIARCQPTGGRAHGDLSVQFRLLAQADGRLGSLLRYRLAVGRACSGRLSDLTPEMRTRLTEPGAVVVDASELDRLGIHGVGDAAEIYGHRVSVVGLLHGFKSVGGPYVFCSLRTARMILPMFQEKPHDTMYLLARCRDPREANELIERLRQYPDLSAFTRDDFSLRTRLYWLTQTNAGIGMGCTAGLALLGRPGRHQSNAVRGHRRFAARVRRAACPGHPALAHGGDGAGAIVLGGTVRHRPGHAGDFPAGCRREFRRGSRAAAAVAVRWGQCPDDDDGLALRPGRAAIAAAGGTDHAACGDQARSSEDAMSSAKPTLEARHLSRSFGDGRNENDRSCDDVSLDLYGGEVALLMGPSGSGKSTLLAVLSGLLRPDSGEVIALGQRLAQMSESEQRAVSSAALRLHLSRVQPVPSLTAREQLEMVLRWGEGASAARGRAARRGGAWSGLAWSDAERSDGRSAVRRRKAAGGHRPGPAQGADLLFRR